MKRLMICLVGIVACCALGISWAQPPRETAPTNRQQAGEERIDFERARELLQKMRRGERLTDEEAAYLERAREARRAAANQNAADQPARRPTRITPRESTGLVPLCDMAADDEYKGEDGGLYGRGQNTPPAEHRRAAEQALARVQPLNQDGQPAREGRIVFVSISMSNATQEFSRFKQIADRDNGKSDAMTIVDCAQGGQAMAEWTSPDARPWQEAMRRIEAANVSPQQVQIAWIKLANKGPSGELQDHGRKLQRDTQTVIQNAKAKFPNLQVAYLSSRIYGGYATSALNPEPYAYESAFAVRWLIQDQIVGNAELNHDPEKGPVKAPVILWGPYLWADGVTPRGSDKLIYTRDDLAADGTHPSQAGRDKVARLMLDFYKSDPLSRPWFTGR